MTKTFLHSDDDDNDNILRDGERLRVPLRFMDSVQRDIAQHFGRVSDGTGDSGLGLHRPGFRVADASSDVERRRVYDQYDTELTTSWKNNPPTGEGSGEFRGQREGDQCTINGSPGHLKMIGGKLHCVPDARKKDAMPMLDEREAAYRAYDQDLQQTYRSWR